MTQIPLPDSKYRVLLADPPWSYRDKANDGKRGADHKYATMKTDEIAAMPVAYIAEQNSVLFLWATAPMEEDAKKVMKAWGFRYATWAFIWIKTNADGSVFRGMGHYTRANAEPCLLGVRGKTLERLDKGVSQVILSPRRKHSQKPPEAAERIVRLYGDVPRLEMFARERTPGWDVWGDQVPTEVSS